MAFDFSSFDKAVGKTKNFDFSSFDKAFSGKKDFDFSSFDSIYSADEPTTGKIVKGVGAEMGASVAGSVAGGIIGGTLGSVVPFFGTAVGATVGTAIGGFAGGFLGSLWAQDIEGQEDVSVGRALGAGVVSAIPLGGAAVKGAAGATKIGLSTVGRAAGREAVKGAALGTTEATIRTVVDEGRMPTKEELATYAGAGALFGGALGAVTPKVSKELDNLFGKVGGKTFDEVDEMVANGTITYKDLDFIAVKSKVSAEPTPAPKTPEVAPEGRTIYRAEKVGQTDDGLGLPFYTEDKTYVDLYMGEGRVIKEAQIPENVVDIRQPEGRAKVRKWAETKIEALEKAGHRDDFLREAKKVLNEDSPAASARLLANLTLSINKQAGRGLSPSGVAERQFLTETGNSAMTMKEYGRDIDEYSYAILPEKVKALATPKEAPVKPTPAPKASMEGILRQRLEETKGRVKSQVAVESVDASTENPSNLVRMKDRFLSIFAPSWVVGKEARNEALSFRKRIAAAEELGGRVERRVSAAIKKDPLAEAKVNAFLQGKDLDPSLGDLRDDLVVYRDRLDELQGELINQLELDHMASLESGELQQVTDKILELKQKAESLSGKKLRKAQQKIKKQEEKLEATPQLIEKIKKSREVRDYTTREYRMFTDSDFVPDLKLREKARDEMVANMLAKNKNMSDEVAKARVEKQLTRLEAASAGRRKLKTGQGGKSKDESVLMRWKNVGPAERAWLGEITETGERIRGTLSGVARLVARKQTDRNVANILAKNGLAVPADKQLPGMRPLELKAGETTGLYVPPEVQASINRLYLDGAQQRSNNPVIAGLQDLYSSAVGLSKATKVLLNPPSYAVQVYGNTINLLGMGINPFGGASKGIRLALSEYGGLEYLMSKAGKTKREEFLKELNDMTKYGIKGENIMASDIRDAFERGLFSKAADKPIGFFGKAYSVPDTVGRYVGWKAQQKMMKKIYPHLGNEEVKRLAAEVINDTYQNYDRLSGIVKSLSRSGIMPQFASFTAEFMRNQYNQGKIIGQMLAGSFGAELGIDVSRANVKAMRMEGAKRLASLATVYGATGGTIAAINRDGGVEEKDEEHIRELLPSWDQTKSLAMRLSPDGKQVSYANASYIAPHALGLAALEAGISGEPIDNLSRIVVEEFFGEGTFVNRAMMEAINNRNARGQKISYSEKDLESYKDRLEYFIKETFKPGAMREVKKLDEALRGVGDLTTKQVLARQIGYRVNTVDFAENAKYLMMEHKDNADMARREFTKARDEAKLRPEDLEALYQQANAARKESMALVARRNANLINRGYTEEERINVMKEAGLSGKDILATLEGRYNDIDRVARQSASDRYSELTGDMGSKRKQIIDIMKTDRPLGKQLMSAWERERKSASSGKTSRDDLLRGFSVAERVDYLRNNPDRLQELRRKGIATNAVLDAYRILER